MHIDWRTLGNGNKSLLVEELIFRLWALKMMPSTFYPINLCYNQCLTKSWNFQKSHLHSPCFILKCMHASIVEMHACFFELSTGLEKLRYGCLWEVYIHSESRKLEFYLVLLKFTLTSHMSRNNLPLALTWWTLPNQTVVKN